MTQRSVLIVEDDAQTRSVFAKLIRRFRFDVTESSTCAQARALLTENRYDVVLTDLHLPDGKGLDVIAHVRAVNAEQAVIVVTGDLGFDSSLLAHELGVTDVLYKPFGVSALHAALQRGCHDGEPAEREASGTHPLPAIDVWRRRYAPTLLGEHPQLAQLFRTLERVCDTDCSVLVTGETGTGKELVARALHAASDRRKGPFVAVNCSAIPEQLVESELFGHARGAFTGAVGPRVGRFAAADTGTLFLDEIGELPLSQQAKLLRAIQEREILPLGETRPRKVDVRIVAATHRDLEQMTAQGTFREDLLYRIEVVPVHLPALRERRNDIPALVTHFIAETNQRRHRAVTGISPQALSAICAYDWPGNVRQLENTVERMVLLRSHGELEVDDLPPRIGRLPTAPAKCGAVLPEDGIDLRDAVEQYENSLILQALERTGWNKNRAAAVLRMNRTTLVEKLKKKHIDDTNAA